MKNFDEFLNEGIDENTLSKDISDVFVDFEIYIEKLIKTVCDNFGLILDKQGMSFSISYKDNYIFSPDIREHFKKLVLTRGNGDVIHSEDELIFLVLHKIYLFTHTGKILGSVHFDIIIENIINNAPQYLDIIRKKSKGWLTYNFKKPFKLDELISDEIKQKYQHIFKNDLF